MQRTFLLLSPSSVQLRVVHNSVHLQALQPFLDLAQAEAAPKQDLQVSQAAVAPAQAVTCVFSDYDSSELGVV